ncbi:MAG: hypothetical protein ABR585_07910 [Gemmatimonadaceae bacterium]
MIRNVFSSVTGLDVTTEYADAVREQLNTALQTAGRESSSKDKWGQLTARSALISYDSPDTGAAMWAHYYADGAVEELEEADSREEAEKQYEDSVRALAGCAGPNESWWQVTDVDGVPTSDGEDDDED